MNVESHGAQSVLVDRLRDVVANLPDNQLEALECAYFGA
jgi:hypothetical protein